MGKIKVHELAKKLNISNAQLIEKLGKMGVEVKSHLSILEEDVVKKVMNSSSDKKNTKIIKEKKEQIHIIRRNVKVIKSEEKSKDVNQVSTNVNGNMKNTKYIEEDRKKTGTDISSKESLGIIRPKSKYPRGNKFANRTLNVVITRNGKPVEKKEEKNSNINTKESIHANQVQKIQEVKLENEDTSPKENTVNVKNNNLKEEKVNNKYNDTNNKNKNNYNNRNNDNNKNKNFQSDNKKITNKYKTNRNNNNNNNNNFKNRNNVNNTNYQVNKFIKQESNNPVESKEVREYNNFDKKKHVEKSTENKKDRIDKNKLREKNSRVSTSRLKGMEIDSSSGLLDLYERDNDNSRKYSAKKKKGNKVVKVNQTKIIPMTEVKLPEVMTVKEFAESIKKQVSEIIKKLLALGIMATQNQEVDFDTAYLIASDFGITATKQVNITEEDILFDDSEDDEKDLVARAPIVVVMGHVDHGKTSLLDRIRSENVVSGEAGGITQHIGAYRVKCKNKEICFLDTPGHEAFTAMRARGAQVTDIAIIVVAADDGIKPQTIEAIDHAKAAGVSIIVAINKIDKPTADVERVKQELLEVGLVAEEWGGDTICVPISAKTGEGIDNLLEMILLVADMKELKVNPKKQAKGTILEARLDKSIGTVVSVLVQRGELNVGDTIVVGDIVGKIRAMKDDKGKRVKKAGPSTPVEIIGLSHVPHTGDVFYEVENEKVAKHLVEKRKASERKKLIKQGSKVTLDDLFGQIKQGKLKELNVIIKADVQGSVEALKDSLEKLSNDEVIVKILHASTGGIKESDVTLASVSNAIIIGFNVRPESLAKAQAEKEKVDLRLYRVIYDAIDDVEIALKGLLPKKYTEVMHGTCEVRKIFKITGVGIVAGCYVKTGSIIRGTMVRLVRNSIVVFDAKIDSLKREKDDVKEVAQGYECGIKLEGINDIKDGDIFECYELIEEKR